MNEEEIKQRKQELRKLRETTVEQKQQEFLAKWKDIITILKKTKTDIAQTILDNLNNGIPPTGKALEVCNKLLEDSIAKSSKTTPTRRKKTTNATTTRNNRTKNQKAGQPKK